MPETIENYTSKDLHEGLKKQSFKIWSVVLFLVSAWVFLILLAPIARADNLVDISRPIYGFFGHICHQMPSRSFHLWGHQFAVCSRCFGVYFGLALGLAFYPLFRSMKEVEPLPRVWLILATFPIAIDWSLTFFGIWENTFFTRVATGLILGIACAIFIVPALVELSQMWLLRGRKRADT